MANLRDDIFARPTLSNTELDSTYYQGLSPITKSYRGGRITNDINPMLADIASLEADGTPEARTKAAGLRDQVSALEQRRAAYAPEVGKVENINGIGSGLTWAGEQVGQGVASMQDMMLTGAGLTAAGRAVGAIPHPIARAAGMALQGGGVLAPYLMNQRQLAGEAYGDMTEDAALMARTTPQQRYEMARNYGALAAIPDTALLALVGRQLAGAGLRKGLSKIGPAAMTGLELLGEGTTELGQEVGKQYALGQLNPERDTSQDASANLNSFLGGAVGAGPFAAAGAYADAGYRRVGDTAEKIGTKAGQVVDLAGQKLGPMAEEAAKKGRGWIGAGKEKVDTALDSFKGEDGRIDLSKVVAASKETAGEVRDNAARAVFGITPQERDVLEQNVPEDILNDQDPAKMSAWLTQNDQARAGMVTDRLSSIDDPQAADIVSRIAAAAQAQDIGAQQLATDEGAKYLLDRAEETKLAGRAERFAQTAGSVAATAGKGALEFGKAVVDGVKKGLSKKNAQVEPWEQRKADMQAARRSAPAERLAQLWSEALAAAAPQSTIGEKGTALFRSLGERIADLTEVSPPLNQINRIAQDIRVGFGKNAEQILDNLASMGDKKSAPTIEAIRAAVVAGRTPAGQRQIAQERQAVSGQLLALLPIEQAKSIIANGQQMDLLEHIEDFADGHAAPALRPALEAAVGKDALAKMVDLVNGVTTSKDRGNEALLEARDDDVTDYELRQAEKKSVKGSGPKIYGVSKSPVLRDNPFAPNERMSKEEFQRWMDDEVQRKSEGLPPQIEPEFKRPMLFKTGDPQLDARVAHMGEKLDSTYHIAPRSAWEVMDDTDMPLARRLATYRDYMREDGQDTRTIQKAVLDAMDGHGFGWTHDAADQLTPEQQQKSGAQNVAGRMSVIDRDRARNMSAGMHNPYRQGWDDGSRRVGLNADRNVRAQGGVPSSARNNAPSVNDLTTNEAGAQRPPARLTDGQRNVLFNEMQAYFSERHLAVAEQIADREPSQIGRTELLSMVRAGKRAFDLHRMKDNPDEHLDQSNLLMFKSEMANQKTGAPGVIYIPVHQLVKWVQAQRERSETVEVKKDDEKDKTYSNRNKNEAYLADVMEGISIILNSGMVEDQLPARVEGLSQGKKPKLAPFTEQNIPKNLRLATMTYGQMMFGREKAAARRAEEGKTELSPHHNEYGSAKNEADDLRDPNSAFVAEQPPDNEGVDPYELWGDLKQVKRVAERTVDTGIDRGRRLRIAVAESSNKKAKQYVTTDPDATPLDFFSDIEKPDIPDEFDDQQFRTKNGGKSAYLPLPAESKMNAWKEADKNADALLNKFRTGDVAGGLAEIEQRLRAAKTPSYSPDKYAAVGGLHYAIPLAQVLNPDVISTMDIVDADAQRIVAARAELAGLVRDAKGFSDAQRLRLTRAMAPAESAARITIANYRKALEKAINAAPKVEVSKNAAPKAQYSITLGDDGIAEIDGKPASPNEARAAAAAAKKEGGWTTYHGPNGDFVYQKESYDAAPEVAAQSPKSSSAPGGGRSAEGSAGTGRDIGALPMYYRMPPEGLRADLRGKYPAGTTTAQLMADGLRTATTRRVFGEVGDVFTVGGTKYRITGVAPIDLRTAKGRAAWAQKEGWDPEYAMRAYPAQVRDGAIQTTFERVVAPGGGRDVTVIEHQSVGYRARTKHNADSAGLTVAIAADYSTAGEKLTKNVAGEKYLAIPIDVAPDKAGVRLAKAMRQLDTTTLNVAGNGIYTLAAAGHTQASVNEHVFGLIKTAHKLRPITKIVTGGQTGVDIAGAVAARALGIPVTVTMPRGFLQRNEAGQDQRHSAADIERQIEDGAKALSPAPGGGKLESRVEGAASWATGIPVEALELAQDIGIVAPAKAATAWRRGETKQQFMAGATGVSILAQTLALRLQGHEATADKLWGRFTGIVDQTYALPYDRDLEDALNSRLVASPRGAALSSFLQEYAVSDLPAGPKVIARAVSKIAGAEVVKLGNIKADGEFNTVNGGITVSRMKTLGTAATVLHEGVHAATAAAIVANPELSRALYRLLAHVTSHNPQLAQVYGTTNTLEFLAEGLSNMSFQRELYKIPANETVAKYLGRTVANAWEAFVTIVRKALNIPAIHDSALTQLISLGGQAMKETAALGTTSTREAFSAYAARGMVPLKQFEQLVAETAAHPKLSAAGSAHFAKFMMRDLHVNDGKVPHSEVLSTTIAKKLLDYTAAAPGSLGAEFIDRILVPAVRTATLRTPPAALPNAMATDIHRDLVPEPEWVYHGTRADEKLLIDSEGNLVLKPSKNFGGKTIGVSFTKDRASATDYATRIKGGGPDGFTFKNAKLLKIHPEALKNLEQETFGELADYTGQNVVVPKGMFSIEPLPRARHFLRDSHLLREAGYSFHDYVNDNYRGLERDEAYEDRDTAEQYLDEVVDAGENERDVTEAKAILRDQFGRKLNLQDNGDRHERNGPSHGFTRRISEQSERFIQQFRNAGVSEHAPAYAVESKAGFGPVAGGTTFVARSSDGTVHAIVLAPGLKDAALKALREVEARGGTHDEATDVLAKYSIHSTYYDPSDRSFGSISPEEGSPAFEYHNGLGHLKPTDRFYDAGTEAASRVYQVVPGASRAQLAELYGLLKAFHDYTGGDRISAIWRRDSGANPGKQGGTSFNAQDRTGGPRVASDADIAEAKAYFHKVLGPKVKVLFKEITGYSGEWLDAENTAVISTMAAAGTMQTAYHEALHAFFSKYVKGDPKVLPIMKALAENERILERVKALLHEYPAALAQLADGEERLAYIYQFWAAGLLKLGPGPGRTWLQKLGKFFRGVLGLVSDSERAVDLLEAFHAGKMAEPSAAGRVIAKLTAQPLTVKARRKLDGLSQLVAAATLPAESILLNSPSAAVRALGRKFFSNPGDEEAGKYPEAYLNARKRRSLMYHGVFARAVAGLDSSDLKEVAKYLQQGTDPANIPYKPHADAVKGVREALDRFYTYMKDEKGLSVGYIERYYPVIWSTDILHDKKDEFIKMLTDNYGDILAKGVASSKGNLDEAGVAERIWAALIRNGGGDNKIAPARSDGVLVPYFESGEHRVLNWIKPEHREPFLQKDLIGQISKYFHEGARKAEYQSRFGEHGEKLSKLLDPQKKAFDELRWADANKDGPPPGLLDVEYVTKPGQKTLIIATFAGTAEMELMAEADKMVARGELKNATAAKKWVARQMRDVRQAVGAMEGTLGKDIPEGWRKFNSWMTVYQNVRLLPLALFSSIVDPLGMVARGAELKDAYAAFLAGMKEVVRAWGNEFRDEPKASGLDPKWTRLAEAVGATEAELFAHHVSEEFSSDYMVHGAKTINDKMFILNGMEAWNRAMRIAATKAAVEFIMKHKGLPDKIHSARWLQELGLKPEDIVLNADGELVTDRHELARLKNIPLEQATKEMQRTHWAINRWVEGAILTPNAAQRPSWSSDPRWGIFFHLKQFTYSFHYTLMKRAVKELEYGNLAPIGAFAWYIPVMLASDITRGLIQGGGELPAYMKGWDVGDHLINATQRAGFLSVGQIGVDAVADPASLGGPAIEQMIDAMRDPLEHSTIKALPLQPIFRNAVLS